MHSDIYINIAMIVNEILKVAYDAAEKAARQSDPTIKDAYLKYGENYPLATDSLDPETYDDYFKRDRPMIHWDRLNMPAFGDVDIGYELMNLRDDKWHMYFEINGRIAPKGLDQYGEDYSMRDIIELFTEVLQSMYVFLAEQKPKSIYWTAITNPYDTAGRKNMYDRLIERYRPIFESMDYNIEITETRSVDYSGIQRESIYTLTKTK